MTTRIQIRRDTSTNWISNNPILAAGEQGLETNTAKQKIGDGTSNWVALPYVTTNALTPTTVKTSAYTAAPYDLVLCDTSFGATPTGFTVTLPTTPADKSIIAIKLVAQASTNAITVAAGGTAHYNLTTGGTTATIKLLSQVMTVQYQSSNNVWIVINDDLPLGQLDSRYASATPNGVYVPTSGLGATVLNVNSPRFGAKGDGGGSATGALNISTAVITDTTPSTLLPVANQLATWVGLGPSVGGGIAGVAITSSWVQNPIIQTNSAHGLSDGQQVTIAGATGATWLNSGQWVVTVVDTTHFAIALNVAAAASSAGLLPAWVSGGTINPTQVLTGYVSNPLVSVGTLTYTMVTASGGSTPITIPASTATSGKYYYGSDDTTAVAACFALAGTLSSANNPVTVTGSGVSMVSSLINVVGNVMVTGQNIDMTRDSLSYAFPGSGFVLRPHGIFANAATSPVIQFGSTSATPGYTLTAGTASGSDHFTVDAANICKSAIRNVAYGANFNVSLACNGIQAAWLNAGPSALFDGCIGSQTQCGDALRMSSGEDINPNSPTGTTVLGNDSAWRGGVLRLGRVQAHLYGVQDPWLGDGVHYYGGGSSLSCNVLIEDITANSFALGMTPTSGSPTVTCTGISTAMAGMPLVATGIPASSFVGSGGNAPTPGTSFTIVNGSNTPVNATSSPGAELGIVGSTPGVSVPSLIGGVYDTAVGPQIRLCSHSSASNGIYAVNIGASTGYQVTGGWPDATYPFIQVDAQTGKITDVVIDGTNMYAQTSHRYLSVIDIIGTLGRINMGLGNARGATKLYSGPAARTVITGEIGPFDVYNYTSGLLSVNYGQTTITGNGATTAFTVAHGLVAAPATGAILASLAADSSPVGFTTPKVTADATNITFTFDSAPTSGTQTYNWRAAI